jgi:arylsulfatase A-like enzyme
MTNTVRFAFTAALVIGCSRQPKQDEERAAPAATSSAHAAAKAAAATPPDAGPAVPAPKRPYNVLLIMIDSLRSDMPWAGYPRDIAPWLTRFQKESCVVYPNAYSLSSYTAKSVGPALVGEYPSAMPHTASFFTQYPDAQNLFVSERARKAGVRTLAGHAHGYFMPRLGNNQGFDDYRLIPGAVDLKAVTSITSEPLTKLAMDMLGAPENTGKRPFFAYFHYLDPHHTYEKHKGHPDFGSKPRDVYDNEVHYTDKWVGTLLDWAKQQPWWSRTVVMITADHGEGFGERGQFRHAYELWESLVRVPWFICVPGVAPRHIAVRRSHVDLAPTIADLLGLPADPPFTGKSLVDEVFGKVAPEPRRIVVDLPRADLMDRRRGVIDGDYKLLGFGDDTRFMLFNVAKDPWEAEELSKTEPDQLERMKRVYQETSEKIPVVPVVGGGTLKGAPPGRGY